jgi:protein-tyrosine phosphatase
MTKILFVCTGNICRSPTAHAIARHKVKELNLQNIEIDSAGTSGFHKGEKPDPRSISVGSSKGIDFSGINARPITRDDFKNFDLIFGMDRGHVSILRNLCPEKFQSKIHLFLEYANVENNFDDEVIDPYYGEKGFTEVFELIEKAVEKIIID